MKLNVFNRKKTGLEKLTSTYDVKLDASASQLIMDVLAKLYDNPVEAAIREYVSNAYDANVETDLFALDDKGFSPDTYLKVYEFLDYNYSKIETLFPNVTKKTHLIADNTNDYLDSVYDFVLPENNKTIIISTIDNDEIDWILKNKPNVSYFTKADMDTRAKTINTIIEPLLNNDNTRYVVKMLIKDTADEIVHKVQL